MDRGTTKAYQEKMEAQLRDFEADLMKVRAKADKAKAELKIESQRQLELAKAKADVIATRLRELGAVGQEKYAEIKTDIEGGWQELRTAVDKVIHSLS